MQEHFLRSIYRTGGIYRFLFFFYLKRRQELLDVALYKIGVIYIILTIQMSLLQYLFKPDMEKNLKKIWKALLKRLKKI